jgi:hypothetical protein
LNANHQHRLRRRHEQNHRRRQQQLQDNLQKVMEVLELRYWTMH